MCIVSFQVFRAMSVQRAVFCIVTSCSLGGGYQQIIGTCRLLLQTTDWNKMCWCEYVKSDIMNLIILVLQFCACMPCCTFWCVLEEQNYKEVEFSSVILQKVVTGSLVTFMYWSILYWIIVLLFIIILSYKSQWVMRMNTIMIWSYIQFKPHSYVNNVFYSYNALN